jgi:hypothetical protein
MDALRSHALARDAERVKRSCPSFESHISSLHSFIAQPYHPHPSVHSATVTLPLAVYQQRRLARLELLAPRLREWSDAITHNVIVKCRRENLGPEEANKRARKEVGTARIGCLLRRFLNPTQLPTATPAP